jgi:cysteine desulfurase
MNLYPVYLDCNATTPIEPIVCDKIRHYLECEFGNAASRTHIWGVKAKQAVQVAREQIAEVVKSKPDEVIFTSGATESNNLALLGLANHGKESGKRHILTTRIEHKAILEPLEWMSQQGFEIEYLSVGENGIVNTADLKSKLREDTLAVSIMHVNNETGVIQPLDEVIAALDRFDAFFHTDASQGFGKEIATLQNSRIDMISISGHKIYGPKGVGSLILRRRGFKRLPLSPIMYGGGHEKGLRPGTLPVHLIAGLGTAAELALKTSVARTEKCMAIREKALAALLPIGGVINGDPEKVLPHVLNISFPGLDSEAALVALKDLVAISNGSACTSQSYDPSHVLVGMGLSKTRISSALRISWCHMTNEVDWALVGNRIKNLL